MTDARAPARYRGFTAIELMVTVAIVAILAALAFPSFESTLRSNRLATSTNQFVAAVALARSEAIRTTRGAGICVTSNGVSCSAGSDWSAGWMAWADVNANGAFDAGTDRVLRYMQGNSKIKVTGPATSLSFDSRGRLNGAQQTFDVQPVQCGTQALRRTLTLMGSGQLRKSASSQTCT